MKPESRKGDADETEAELYEDMEELGRAELLNAEADVDDSDHQSSGRLRSSISLKSCSCAFAVGERISDSKSEPVSCPVFASGSMFVVCVVVCSQASSAHPRVCSACSKAAFSVD